ncbi:Imm21 family immunity protein [Kitasatospora sp. NPDC101183]|uniref:Imm21 family immunity protein n=1 Tax=Kitasatospora sp. NPDC101183 TaxID=3364100 RepID=UPI0038198EF8
MVEWLDCTDSGRYVLCPEAAVGEWTGEEAFETDGESVERCPLPGGGETLTLAEEPLPVTWLARERVFVRPIHIGLEPAEVLLPLVEQALREGCWEDGPVVELDAGRYLLADSVYEGPRIVESGEYLTVELPPGRYRVRSFWSEPPEDQVCYLEQLVPLP